MWRERRMNRNVNSQICKSNSMETKVVSSNVLQSPFTLPRQVLCVGPTGSGKTLCVANKLLNYMPKEFLSHFLNFSARTSANQTQDIIDSKLDKR